MSKILQRSEQKKYNWLLDFNEVIDWIQHYTSERTQRDYLLSFSEFCQILDLTPKTFLNNTHEENEVLLDRAIKTLIEQKKEHRIVKLKSGVNSFLRYYGKKLETPAGEGQDNFGRFLPTPEEDRVYSWLLNYNEINYWIDDYTAENTRANYLTYMHYFLTHVKLTPDKLLEISEDDIIKKYTHVKQKYLQMGKSASAHRIYVVLSTFLESHRKKITFTKRDKVTVEEKRVRRQYIPKKSEIYRMADSSGSLRNRAIILVMFQSGIRKNAVSSLTYGHVKGFLYPELTIPVRMRITDDIDSKNRKYKIKYYLAFLQDEAAEALKTYIDYRKDVEGWQAKDDDLIFISDSNFNSKGMPQPLSSGAINAMVKRSAKHIGLDPERFWAHLLRKSFRKILYQAPIDNDLAEAIMGHQLKNSKENYFDRYDHDWIASEYMKAPFSREGVGRLYHLEKENQKLEAKIATQQEEIESLKDDLTEMKEILNDLFKKQES